MAESIYWYDFETTGINPARDRPLQFAGVRTDSDLNLVGEPLNVFCFPGDDTVPDPEAILVTGIEMSRVQKEGLNEAAFSATILEEFTRPQTCVAGYNSIRFDDEFTRYLLYRNFHDPYAREWQGGNSRWDVIDLFRMAYALRPENFEWPLDEDGVVSFRLEKLSVANGVRHEDAHDAVSDVLATINTVRKLREAQPKLYDYLYQLRGKKAVLNQLYPLGKAPLVHVSSMYPARQSCVAVVLPLCVQPGNNNGVVCVDLSADVGPLLEVGPEELRQRLFTSSVELGDVPRMPLKTIHINRCPAIAPIGTLKNRADTLGIDLGLCETNRLRIQKASGVVEKISEAFGSTDFPELTDVDLMLYQGDFFSNADRDVMQAIHEAKPEDLVAFKRQFQDPRLPEMLFRYRARNYPASLDEAEKQRWLNFRRNQPVKEKGVDAMLAKTRQMLVQAPDSVALKDLARYLEGF